MSTSGFTRREFTFALAGGAALAADQASVAVGQDAAKPKPATASPEATADSKVSDNATSEVEPANEPREPPPEAAYLLGLIMRRYPDDRLDEVAVSGIVRDIYGDLARSQTLSRFPLKNSDEPGFTFKAWRAD